MKVENLKQKEAFEYYYSLGDKRNCSRVADEFQVSERTVYNWSKWFKWQERLQERDIKNADKLAEQTDETILNAKSKYIALIQDTLQEYRRALKSGDIKFKSALDLERLAKLELSLREEEKKDSRKFEVIIRDATAEDVKHDFLEEI